MPKITNPAATSRDQLEALAPKAGDEMPTVLPRDNRNRLDVEGALTSHLFGGYAVLLIDECELEQMIAFHFKTPRDERQRRCMGRVRISIEPITE